MFPKTFAVAVTLFLALVHTCSAEKFASQKSVSTWSKVWSIACEFSYLTSPVSRSARSLEPLPNQEDAQALFRYLFPLVRIPGAADAEQDAHFHSRSQSTFSWTEDIGAIIWDECRRRKLESSASERGPGATTSSKRAKRSKLEEHMMPRRKKRSSISTQGYHGSSPNVRTGFYSQSSIYPDYRRSYSPPGLLTSTGGFPMVNQTSYFSQESTQPIEEVEDDDAVVEDDEDDDDDDLDTDEEDDDDDDETETTTSTTTPSTSTETTTVAMDTTTPIDQGDPHFPSYGGDVEYFFPLISFGIPFDGQITVLNFHGFDGFGTYKK